MPLTKKGAKIKRAMDSEYGKEKGDAVFYKSVNAGKITNVHESNETEKFCNRLIERCNKTKK